jgi:mono/diheme cytochrome c family protein
MSRLALALALAALLAPAAHAQAPPDGAALYRLRCGMCHQARGFGTNTLARRLGPGPSLLEARTDLVPAYVRQVVRRGLGSMPPFTKVELSEPELAAIAGYLARPRAGGS